MAFLPQEDRTPIILDDPYDLVEAAFDFGGEHQEALLSKGELRTALLSMSGYGKPRTPSLNNYDTSRPGQTNVSPADYYATRPGQDQMYLAYAQPGFGESQVHGLPTTYDQNADHMPYPASSFYEPRATTYDEVAQSSIINYGSRKLPVVTSHSPHQGPQGSPVYVYLRSTYSLTAPSPLVLSLMFATQRCLSDLTLIEAQGSSYEYVLAADAPPLSYTACNSTQVPLRLHVQEESGPEIGMIDVGSYLYTDGIQHQPRASPEDTSRKRRLSMEPAGALRFPAKRPSNQQLQSKSTESYTSYPYARGTISAYSQASQPIAVTATQNNFAAYCTSPSSRSLPESEMSRRVSQEYSVGTTGSQPLKISSPHRSACKSYTAISQANRSPGSSATPTTGALSISPPNISANPPLIRTSTLQQSPSPAATPAASSMGGSFNPYAIYPHKAVLKIKGHLDSMADKWTADEWISKRRLVQFWRSQSGSTIHTHFQPVEPDNRPPNSICISCIWWEERQECFVTSVDTIFLLESLVAVRFTVEEKNRIRRNLEGFRPMTVSKAKADSEDFFKLIMGFPNPKPRNIEKDVKVFPWKILAHALKKIIGKYSASYSSTAGALPTPRSSGYGFGQPQSEPSADHRLSASPHSTSNSTISSAYSTTLTSTTMSPTSHGRLAAPVHFSEAPPLQVSVPTLSQAYTVPSLQSQYAMRDPMSSAASGQVPMTGPPARASWDFSTLFDTSPATVSAGTQQMSQYHDSPASKQSSSKHDIR